MEHACIVGARCRALLGLMLTVFAVASAPAIGQCTSGIIFREGGSNTAIALGANTLYEGMFLGVRVFDTTTPSNIVKVGALTLDMTPSKLELQGTLLYALGDDGLRIIDVSNPAVPTLVYSLAGFVGTDLAVGPNRLFLIRNNAAEFYNTTNPAAPTLAHTQIVDAGSVNAIALEYRGTTLYYAQSRVNDCLVQAFNTSTLATPVIQGSYLSGGSVSRTASRTGFLALYRTAGAIDLVDITTPSSMSRASLINGLFPDNFGQAVLAFGQTSGTPLLYSYNSGHDLICYSLANPAAPSASPAIRNYSGVTWTDLAASGSLVASGETTSGSTYLYDLSTPATPVYMDTSDVSPYGVQYMALLPGHLILSAEGTALVYNITTPSAATLVSTFEPISGNSPINVVTNGDTAFFGQTNSPSLRAWDLSNPAAPVFISALQGNTAAVYTLANNGPMLYIASNAVFKVVDATNPAAMVSRGSVATGVYPDSSWYDHGHVFVADDGNGNGLDAIRVYNVANPDSPALVATYTTRPAATLRAAAGGDRLAYILQSDDRLDVFDVTNPASPVLKSSLTFGGDVPLDIMLADSVLGVNMQTSDDIVFYDMADPAAPNQLNNTLNPGLSPIAYTSRNQTLWTGGFYQGLTAARLPGRPRFSVRPTDAPSCPSGTAVFSVTVANDNNVTYRWQRNGLDLLDGPNGAFGTLSGAGTRSLTITAPSNTDTGVYRCKATNNCATVTSSGAQLQPILAPFILLQPNNDTICPGGTATFSVAWLGTQPATFTWQVESITNPGTWFTLNDGVVGSATISGATTRFLNIQASAVTPAMLSRYRCTITNGCASVTTNGNAQLTLDTCPCGDADLGRQGGLSGPDGVLDNNDFVVFINYFFTLDGRADFGSQGGIAPGDGLFDNNDFVVFINAFFTGC